MSEKIATLPFYAGSHPCMKKSFLVLALALAISPLASFAQDAPPAAPGGPGGGRGGPRMTPEERLKTMKETLGLTDDQVAKIKAIFEENAPKMKALRDDTALSQEDRRAKFTELRTAETAAITAVLTPDQQAKFKAEQEKRRGGGRPGGPGGAGAPPAAK